MSSKIKGKKISNHPPQRILPKKENVIYILPTVVPEDEQQSNGVIEIMEAPPPSCDPQQIYQIIENAEEYTEGDDKESYTETITIVSDDVISTLDNEIVYVTNDSSEEKGEGKVTFMQIGGPDVASEETIETSMIVEIPEDSSEDVSISHLTSDHCYTFKRGIKPKDLEKAKTKAAMMGETPPQSQQPTPPYTFILPKHTPTKIAPPDAVLSPMSLEPRRSSQARENRCGKHRWLWQFMKELLFVGDPSIQWYNQREGSFTLKDQDQLAIKWECYKKLHKMKAQVWRQMRYYFGWMEENKIVRPVPEAEHRFQFVEKFYREKFLPYRFKPHTDLKALSRMASEMDCAEAVLSRYKHGHKDKVYCIRGCGSQFINKEACSRHESVCTYTSIVISSHDNS